MCGHTHAHRLISLTVFLQYYEPLLSLSRETCSYIYNANVSVLCFPSKACLCSPVFLRIIRTAVLLWPGQCRETSYYVSCLYMVEFKPVLPFSKPSISWQSRAMFNKRFRVLYATVAPGPRTRNRINPVVLHESLQSTISWLLCLEWINCSKLCLLCFPQCISPMELICAFPNFEMCFVLVI